MVAERGAGLRGARAGLRGARAGRGRLLVVAQGWWFARRGRGDTVWSVAATGG